MGRVFRRLAEVLAAAGASCTVHTDGMAVEIDDATIYEPDAMMRCGAPLPDNAVKVTDPVIVVEVLSPSPRTRDAGAKLDDYFCLPTVRHYLITKTENQTIIHHERDAAARITTRIVRTGPIRLDPTVIVIQDLFAPAMR